MTIRESAFHDARKLANPQPCAFEIALLARCVDCSLVRRLNMAERETLGCADGAKRETCLALRGHLQRNAAFALKLAHPPGQLSHASEMKIQCGGLRGLHNVLSGQAGLARDSDVSVMVEVALRQYVALDRLPYSAIIRAVAAFNVRRRQA